MRAAAAADFSSPGEAAEGQEGGGSGGGGGGVLTLAPSSSVAAAAAAAAARQPAASPLSLAVRRQRHRAVQREIRELCLRIAAASSSSEAKGDDPAAADAAAAAGNEGSSSSSLSSDAAQLAVPCSSSFLCALSQRESRLSKLLETRQKHSHTLLEAIDALHERLALDSNSPPETQSHSALLPMLTLVSSSRAPRRRREFLEPCRLLGQCSSEREAGAPIRHIARHQALLRPQQIDHRAVLHGIMPEVDGRLRFRCECGASLLSWHNDGGISGAQASR